MTVVRCSELERSRSSKMFYCNIRTPVHRVAIPKVMWLLYPKFWVQTFGIATLWTGVSVFCNLHTAFPLYCPVCVPRPRSDFYCHRWRIRSCYPAFVTCRFYLGNCKKSTVTLHFEVEVFLTHFRSGLGAKCVSF